MPSYLTDSGLTVPRGSEYYARFADELNASGTGPWDLSYDEPIGQIVAALSVLLGEDSEGLHAVYDSRLIDNAVGVQLDDLCAIVGVYRLPASEGSVTLRITGTAGTLIPAGSTAQGGGPDGLALWATSDPATIGAGGWVDATAIATETGALAAPIGSITTIDSPASGWDSVDNLAAAATGSDIETDPELRARRPIAMKNTGGQTTQAIAAALLAIDGVQGAICVDNKLDPAVTTGGIALNGHSLAAIVYPSSLTDGEKISVATIMAKQGPIGVQQMGAESATITDDRGVSAPVNWAYALDKSVTTDVTVALATGYVLADVQSSFEASIAEHIDAIGLGNPYYILDILVIAGNTEGITGASVLLDGSAANVTPDLNEQIVAGTIAVHT